MRGDREWRAGGGDGKERQGKGRKEQKGWTRNAKRGRKKLGKAVRSIEREEGRGKGKTDGGWKRRRMGRMILKEYLRRVVKCNLGVIMAIQNQAIQTILAYIEEVRVENIAWVEETEILAFCVILALFCLLFHLFLL